MKRIIAIIMTLGMLTAAAWAAGCCEQGAECCNKTCCKRAR